MLITSIGKSCGVFKVYLIQHTKFLFNQLITVRNIMQPSLHLQYESINLLWVYRFEILWNMRVCQNGLECFFLLCVLQVRLKQLGDFTFMTQSTYVPVGLHVSPPDSILSSSDAHTQSSTGNECHGSFFSSPPPTTNLLTKKRTEKWREWTICPKSPSW